MVGGAAPSFGSVGSVKVWGTVVVALRSSQ